MLAVSLLLVGCSSDGASPQAAPVQDGWDEAPMSSEASNALLDGFVTYQEYRAAFERFRACIVDSGETLTGVGFDPDSGEVRYSVSTGDDICYEREFIAADEAWQLNPERPRRKDELQLMDQLRACIVELGADPVEATTQDPLYQQLFTLTDDPFGCLDG